MYFCLIWQTYSTGVPKIELTNVETQEKTASFTKKLNKKTFYTYVISIVLQNSIFLKKKKVFLRPFKAHNFC